MSTESIDETMTAADLRIKIAEEVGDDIRDRVENVGNSRGAVQFERDTLLSIAFRIPNRRGDARDLREMNVTELREFIAANTRTEEPCGMFNWLHLKAIWREIGGAES